MSLVQYACSDTEEHCTDLDKKPCSVQDNDWKTCNVAGELLYGTNNKTKICHTQSVPKLVRDKSFKDVLARLSRGGEMKREATVFPQGSNF